MNKAEFIDFLAKKSDLTKAKSAEVLDLVIEGITGSLKKGEEVKWTGFGNFKVTKRKATTGRNPQTGEAIKIAARKQVKFSAGKELKEVVNR